MSVIPTDVGRAKANVGWNLRTFWRKIAHALDRLVVYQSHRVIPAAALRRSKHDHDRCRRLMQTLHSQS
jgi:hypothetical protein